MTLYISKGASWEKVGCSPLDIFGKTKRNLYVSIRKCIWNISETQEFTHKRWKEKIAQFLFLQKRVVLQD